MAAEIISVPLENVRINISESISLSDASLFFWTPPDYIRPSVPDTPRPPYEGSSPNVDLFSLCLNSSCASYERIAASGTTAASFTGNSYTPNRSTCVLEIKLAEGEQARTAFDRALIILKLFKPGQIKANKYFLGDITSNRLEVVKYYIPWGNTESYLLSNLELTKLIDLWQELRMIDPSNPVTSSFHQAYYKPLIKERFFYYITSLESLFVPKSDTRRNISKRFVKIGSKMYLQLFKDRNKSEAEDFCRACYDIRSAIAHNDVTTFDTLLIKTDSTILEAKINDFVRRAILFYNSTSNMLNDIIQRDDYNNRLMEC